MPLLLTDPRFVEHETGPHPESPERIRAIHKRLEESGLISRSQRSNLPQESDRFVCLDFAAAARNQLEEVHDGQYVDYVARFVSQGGLRIETDTFCSERSFDVACLAAGAAITAVDRVIAGPDRQAVCLVRPPGHHARPAAAMGFCLFNNVAVAAAHARAVHGIERILIVDWDVHHGNGTQEMFYGDGGVHFLSVHRSPFYPGTGAADETGSGPGLGTIFNLPLPFGVSRKEYQEQFAALLTTAGEKCRPQLVLVSAGFDAHQADPIGSLGLETEDFERLTALPLEVAKQYCGGRMVSLLEGGYNVKILAECVECHMRTILNAHRDGSH